MRFINNQEILIAPRHTLYKNSCTTVQQTLNMEKNKHHAAQLDPVELQVEGGVIDK